MSRKLFDQVVKSGQWEVFNFRPSRLMSAFMGKPDLKKNMS